MWSKTKKVLNERMTDNLRKRVRYNFEVYTTKWRRSEMSAFYIYVDDNLWFATSPEYHWKHNEYMVNNHDYSLHGSEYWEAYYKIYPNAVNYALSYGFADVDHMMLFIHEYLNVYSAKDCLDSENYILKMLAVLDRRIGKRTIKRLVDNVSNEPEWFRKFILLRAESEGINRVFVKNKENEVPDDTSMPDYDYKTIAR